jgi:aspartate oxidase
MDQLVGVLRDAAGLSQAVRHLRALASNAPSDRERDAALVGLMITVAALGRNESRGAHHRLDHPKASSAHHTEMTLEHVLHIAVEMDQGAAGSARRVA